MLIMLSYPNVHALYTVARNKQHWKKTKLGAELPNINQEKMYIIW